MSRTRKVGTTCCTSPARRSEQAAALKLSPEQLEARLRPLRERLLAVREKRPAPLLDDKILTAWNGLMIAAYADGYRVLKDAKYRQSAEKAASFVLEKLRTKDGRLLRTYRAGSAKIAAYLEDYAFLALGLLRLHQATGDARWLREAQSLVDRMMADFEDKEEGGFFFTATDHEQLAGTGQGPVRQRLAQRQQRGDSRPDRALSPSHTKRPTSTGPGKLWLQSGDAIAQIPAALPLTLVGLGQYLDERPEAAKEKLDVGRDRRRNRPTKS